MFLPVRLQRELDAHIVLHPTADRNTKKKQPSTCCLLTATVEGYFLSKVGSICGYLQHLTLQYAI